MLDQMAESMFSIVLGGDFQQTTKYKYELLIDEDSYPAVPDGSCEFYILGHKANMKKERILEKRYFNYMAALMI